MAKPELGTKRMCPACGTKYYDLRRDPITCPNCGTVFLIATSAKAAPARPAPVPDEEVVAAEIIEGDVEVVPLEEVEEEAEAEADVHADEDEAAIPEAEALEVGEDVEAEDDDAAPFLDPEAEEGDEDVADLLDVDGEDEDET